MKLLKKSYLLILPLMLLTSCENKVFSLSAEELYLPEPTKIAFTLNESTECALNEDDTLTFYQKYLKDLKFEKNSDIFLNVFSFEYYYDFDEYPYREVPLELRLGNFNYICLVYEHFGLHYWYVCTEPVPYLEMMDFLETHALVKPM